MIVEVDKARQRGHMQAHGVRSTNTLLFDAHVNIMASVIAYSWQEQIYNIPEPRGTIHFGAQRARRLERVNGNG